MQAKLPDVNSAIVRHRTGALAAMSQLNYALSRTELRAINSLLPEDYKVIEDSKEYYSKIKSKDVLICYECKEPILYNNVHTYTKVISTEIQLLYAIEKLLVWQCQKCKFENPIEATDREITKIARPSYTGCMPDSPKTALFGSKLSYKLEFEKWFDIALNEIENKVAKYRTDYAAQQNKVTIPFEDEDDNTGEST